MNKNNLIQFPKKERKNKKSNLIPVEVQKFVISGSIVSIFLIMGLVNSSIFEVTSNTVSDLRAPASDETQDISQEWNSNLVQKMSISASNLDKFAGHPPSQLQKFRYQTLKGNYKIKMNSKGQVNEVVFVDGLKSSNAPKKIEDKKEFLKENVDLFPEYDELVILENDKESDSQKVILKKSNQNVATVNFSLNKKKDLMKLSVENEKQY